MPESNEFFRQAREDLPSPGAPGLPMSRQELADLVNQWVRQHCHTTVSVDANYIGKLERGVIRWPQKMIREALRSVLRVNSDAQLGLSGRRDRTPAAGGVQRRQFIAGVSSISLLDVLAPVAPTPVPAQVDSLDISQIRLAAKTYKGWDNAYGGGLAREAVFAQLRWSAQLLDATCPTKLRPHLFAAVADFGGVAGFMAFDAFAHDDGRRAFRFALRCAEESGDWHVRASVLSKLSRQAIWVGQCDEGLTWVEMALVRADRLTATEQASLHTLRARALAKLGRVQDCLGAVGQADEKFARAKPDEDPAWIAYYDHAQHQGDTAHALFDLSLRGVRTQAAPRLAYAVAHHAPSYTRSRTISRTKLASVLMAAGDPHQGAAIGQRAVDGVHHLRSQRAITDMWELHDLAGRHEAIPDVAALRDRIAETLGEQGWTR